CGRHRYAHRPCPVLAPAARSRMSKASHQGDFLFVRAAAERYTERGEEPRVSMRPVKGMENEPFIALDASAAVRLADRPCLRGGREKRRTEDPTEGGREKRRAEDSTEGGREKRRAQTPAEGGRKEGRSQATA